MTDITSTSFGLLIAYLLPGISGYYALSFYFPPLRQSLQTFTTADANGGLLLLILLASLVIGLQLTVLRWIVFECLRPEVMALPAPLRAEEFIRLSSESRLDAFRAVIDENYRYHQCWGAMTIVIPVLYAGWLNTEKPGLVIGPISICCFVVLEVITAWAAAEALRRYVSRTRHILSLGMPPERPGDPTCQMVG